ncbi:hypothetical protein FNF29_06611 [Cafeteria roenbergensis]|uniref:Uncharacterized protein n=1 Tax=Cafeteria roenbergensis TaxID=33653 RepID=A0A5A8C696_CAFRO|nr:hypothetical protein FNF29_06611 [Cafeteria roenbergensis]|eukprot:KAA0148553.1 hypothetical protein FNF29_06611 [Cafeteria roenbergensis]
MAGATRAEIEEAWGLTGTPGHTDMHVAVSSGDPARVRELLLARPDAVHDRTRLGETPLHIAVARAPREVVQMLCASGADPNARKNTGGSPLHEAAWMGRDSAVGILLRFGADVHALDSTGATPLDMAKAHRRVSTAELLAGRAVQLNELRTDAANQARRREWQTLVAAKAKAARETAAVGPALWETSAPPPRMKPLPFFEADARGGHATGSPGGGASSRGDDGGGWWEAGSAAGLSGRGSVASGWSIASSRAAVAEAGSEAGAAGHRGRGPEADEVDARSVGRVARDADRAARLLLPQDEGPAGAYSRGTSARGTAGTHRG